MKILSIIFDGFEEEEAMAPFALIRRAGLDLTIASYKSVVKGCHNIELSNITLLKDINIKDFDMLIVPGGPHYKFIESNKEILDIIKYFFDNDKFVAGICAAPTIFGHLGYLKGKNYTCFKSMDSDFGGNYLGYGAFIDGKLITATSVAYSIDFAYQIIKAISGDTLLKQVQDHIYYEEKK